MRVSHRLLKPHRDSDTPQSHLASFLLLFSVFIFMAFSLLILFSGSSILNSDDVQTACHFFPSQLSLLVSSPPMVKASIVRILRSSVPMYSVPSGVIVVSVLNFNDYVVDRNRYGSLFYVIIACLESVT